jgi:hypothetical protein
VHDELDIMSIRGVANGACFAGPAGVSVRREGTMSTGLTVKIASLQSRWPIYTRGPEVDAELPPFDRPMLMLQGGLDAATTIEPARRLATAYRRARSDVRARGQSCGGRQTAHSRSGGQAG